LSGRDLELRKGGQRMPGWAQVIISIISAACSGAIALISLYYYRKQTNILSRQFEKPRAAEVVKKKITPLINAIEFQYLSGSSYLLSPPSELDIKATFQSNKGDSHEIPPDEFRTYEESLQEILFDEFRAYIERYKMWGVFDNVKCLNRLVEKFNNLYHRQIGSKLISQFEQDTEIPSVTRSCPRASNFLAGEFLPQLQHFEKSPLFRETSWFELEHILGVSKARDKFENAKKAVEKEIGELRELEGEIRGLAEDIKKELEDVRRNLKEEYGLRPAEVASSKGKKEGRVL